MTSLDKALDLLEWVILQNGAAVTPSEAAKQTGCHLATASRILLELAERGYLEQVSRKEGFRPGPMCAALASRPNRYRELARAAADDLGELARFLHMPVNLAVLHREKRVMIACWNGRPEQSLWQRFIFEDEPDTATLPLLRDDASKHPEGWYDAPESSGRYRIQGHVIQAPRYPAAAFGYGVPAGVDPAEALKRAIAAARNIEEKLNPHLKGF